MKCQILFSRENKKNINILSSAEYALRVVMVKVSPFDFLVVCLNCNDGR